MFMERIDPKGFNGKLALDHYARYVFATQFAMGKRVLDVACGCGYGTHMLKSAGAQSVIGIDISTEAIEYARTHYAGPDISYIQADAHNLVSAVSEPFDLIVSFETIEHLVAPQRFIGSCKKLGGPQAIFVSSVPNDAYLKSQNPFHLQEFDQPGFEALLKTFFSKVIVFPQYFVLTSVIESTTVNNLDQIRTSAGQLVFVGDEQREPDCFVAVCTDMAAPDPKSCSAQGQQFRDYHLALEKLASDRQAWIEELEQGKAWLEAQRANWQQIAIEREAVIQEQKDWIDQLQQGKEWLEEQWHVWQTAAQEYQRQIEKSTNSRSL